jgi:hypothetical protein
LTALLDLEPFVDSAIVEMTARLDGFANTPTEVNMAFWMQAYAFDVVGELAFGRAFGYLASGQDVGGQMANLRGWLHKRFTVGMIPWFLPIFMSPLAGFFSAASKTEQEDQKKRMAVLKSFSMFLTLVHGRGGKSENGATCGSSRHALSVYRSKTP